MLLFWTGILYCWVGLGWVGFCIFFKFHMVYLGEILFCGHSYRLARLHDERGLATVSLLMKCV